MLLKNGDGTPLHWWLEGTFTAQVASRCSSWMRDTERHMRGALGDTPRCVTGRRTMRHTERHRGLWLRSAMAAGIGSCVSRAAHSAGNHLQQLIGGHPQALCFPLSRPLRLVSMSSATISSHSTKAHANRGLKSSLSWCQAQQSSKSGSNQPAEPVQGPAELMHKTERQLAKLQKMASTIFDRTLSKTKDMTNAESNSTSWPTTRGTSLDRWLLENQPAAEEPVKCETDLVR